MAGATPSISFIQSNEPIKPSNLWKMKPHDEAWVRLADRTGAWLVLQSPVASMSHLECTGEVINGRTGQFPYIWTMLMM